MTLYDSVHYAVDSPQISSLDTPALAEADAEWTLLPNISASLGRVWLGPERRILLVSQYHMLHCLQSFYGLLTGPRGSIEARLSHIHHCLNYLRQLLSCHADAGLEDDDFMDFVLNNEDNELIPPEERVDRRDESHYLLPGPNGSWHPGVIRGERVCKDWEVLYKDLELNRQQWETWRESWN